MNIAKRCDGSIFFAEEIRGFRVAAFRVAAHGGTIQNLDSGSALLDLVGNSGLSHHMLPILSRLPIGAASKLFHFRYITMNEWLQSNWLVSFATVTGNRAGPPGTGKSTVLL
jgi:hypothetical protein